MRTSKAVEQIIAADLIDKLKDSGLAALVEALYDGDSYTRSHRINKSALSRKLGVEVSTVNHLLGLCREILAREHFIQKLSC